MEFEKLKSIVCEVLGLDENDDTITMETSFADDLGADSLDIAQILIGIEDEFDIEIPDDRMESIATIGDAVEAIRKEL